MADDPSRQRRRLEPAVDAVCARTWPLTSAQYGMLLETLSAPGEALHIQQVSWRVRGPLDVSALRHAWQSLFERHDVFRMRFTWAGREHPVQELLERVEARIEYADCRGEPSPDRPVAAYMELDRLVEFDLGRPPLMRLAVFRTGTDQHEVVWTHHHIVLDGWSLPLVIGDLFRAYEAFARSRPAATAAAPSFAEFLARYHASAPAPRGEEPRAELTPPGRVVAEGAPAHCGSGFGSASAELSVTATTRLRAAARAARVTLGTVIYGAWALVLGRYAAREDVTFGVTSAGRAIAMPRIESLVGPCLETGWLHLRAPGGEGTDAWLRHVQERTGELVTDPGAVRRDARAWSVVVVQNYPLDVGEALRGDVQLEDLRIGGVRSRVPMILMVVPGAALSLTLLFDRSRFCRLDPDLVLRHLADTIAALGAGEPLAAVMARIDEREVPLLPPFRAPAVAVAETPVERALAKVWADTLGLTDVGVDDSFFALNGDSLAATRLVTASSAALGLELPVSAIFEHPTVRALAAHVEAIRPPAAERGTTSAAIVPDPDARFLPFAMTPVQQAYWLGRGSDFELGNVATHSYVEIDAAGVDLQRLERAFRALVARHDMLRAVVRGDGMMQVLAPADVPDYAIEVHDVRGVDAAAAREALARTRERLSHRTYDARHWPLFQVCATRLDDGRVRLHFSYDLLICDAASLQIAARELHRLYRDPGAALPAIGLTFRDYAGALQGRHRSDEYARAWRYWRSRAPALPPPPDLPLARRPAEIAAPRFHRRRGRLSAAEWRRFRRAAAGAGVTGSAALLAAFARVVAAWSASGEFTLNLTLFQRAPVHPDVDRLVGEFTCLTLLEARISASEAFAATARSVQRQLARDLDHQAVSAVEVLREINRRGDRRGRAIMPVVFTSTIGLGDPGDDPDGALWGIDDAVFGVGQTPQVWLDCQVMQHGGELLFWWDAVDALFPPGLVDDMFGAFGTLVESLADPTAWEQAVPDLRPESQRARHAAVNETETPIAAAALHDSFEHQAQRAPAHLGIIAGDTRLTYAAIDRLSQCVAGRLASRSTGAATVAVVMDKGWEPIVAALGIVRAGAAYVPIDPALPRERLARLLADSGAGVALTQPHLDASLAWPADVTRMTIADDAGRRELAPVPPDARAYVIYTSGSTGSPKGVVIRHDAAWNTICDINGRFGVSPHDRILALSSLSFDLSVYDIFGALAAGATIVVPPASATGDPVALCRIVAEHGVTVWNSVPSLAQLLADGAEREERVLPSLRLMMLSGDWVPVDLVPRLRRMAPGAALVALGGATECSIWSVAYPIQDVAPDWPSIPYGRPLANQRVHVLDRELWPRPDWVPGELYIGGRGLAEKYWAQPERFRESFIVHPRTGERLYKTGDLACHLPDGSLRFLGRVDAQVKVHGHRIEPAEIEAALAAHPHVATAAAVVQQSTGGARHIVAHVVLQPDPPRALPEDARWSAIRALKPHDTSSFTRHRPAAGSLANGLSAFANAVVVGALERLGAFALGAGTAEEMLWRGNIHARYARWLERALAAAASAGLLVREGERYRRADAGSEAWPTAGDEIASVIDRDVLDAEDRRRAHDTLARFRHIAAELPRILAGEVDARSVVSPEGSRAAESPILARAVAEAHQHAAAALSAFLGRSRAGWKVLEVGGDAGALTAHLLPAVPLDGEYWFTDISPRAVEIAHARWGDHPALRVRRYEPEQPPEAQGVQPGTFDVVLASRVLYATRRVAGTLGSLRRALAPGGIVILVEYASFEPWFQLDVALGDGFDRFEDVELRAEHPFLDAVQWQRVLGHAGFPETLVFPDGGAGPCGQVNVLAARACARQPAEDSEPLARFLSAKLPAYMLPARFVVHQSLPLTANGKVDRAALAIADPVPARTVRVDERSAIGPVEELVESIWCEALEAERLDPDAEFFAAGGDSLIATRVVSRIRERLGCDLPLRTFFELGTVRRLAAHLEDAKRREAGRVPARIRRTDGDEAPLSFAQRGVWLHQQLDPESSAYSMTGAYRIERPIDDGCFRRALDAVVRRHEALRTVFSTRAGEPVQVVLPAAPVSLETSDLPDVTGRDLDAALLDLAATDASAPWDLSRGPVIRVRLARHAGSPRGLIVTLHHICADAWSLGLLVRDFRRLYEAEATGRPAALPELPLQYRDFAVWQRDAFRDDVLASHLRYWTGTLLPLPLPPSPFANGERPPAAVTVLGLCRRPLAPEALDRVRRLSRSCTVSLFSVLLAAFDLAIASLTDRREFVIGTSVANRTQGETEDVIGMFVNVLPLRTTVRDDLPVAQFIAAVNGSVVAALAQQDCPFDRIVDAVSPVRERSARTPLVDVLFVFENVPGGTPAADAFAIVPVDGELPSGRFDLNFHVRPRAGAFEVSVSYNQARHSPTRIDRLVETYLTALDLVTAEPAAPAGVVLGRLVAAIEAADAARRRDVRAEQRRQLLGRRGPQAT